MGLKKKSRKGEISIENNNGRIRLRWRVSGERFSLNLPFDYLPENMHHATIKVAEIKLDLAKGCFDATLEKYSPKIETLQVNKAEIIVPANTQVDNLPVLLGDLVKDFNNWAKNIRNVDIDNVVDYLYLRRVLERWLDIEISKIAFQLNTADWSISTYNRRLTMLQTFFTWLVENGKMNANPLKDVRRRRNRKKQKNTKRTPLNIDEIRLILDAIKNNTFCSKSSFHKHSHYYPFLLFIFSTGVRNAEAVGLRVKHVDLTKKRVEISETFARTLKGSNHSARIQKGTKTENTRFLPLQKELITLFKRQILGKQPDDFVFPSPKGLSIDDQMLQKRILKPILGKLGLDERDLYAARHSFGTRAAKQGIPVTDIAYLMGHSTINTAIRNYISVEAPSYKLPSL